jgi:Ni,Fe-hydrogenase III small subunit/NAD-dependent dihydropyrimidine dehydrogenase PreA subunit
MSLLSLLRVRLSQGQQAIADVRTAVPAGFRGRPSLADAACPDDCHACIAACPTPVAAISKAPLAIDLGRCVFCAECATACPEAKITFGESPHMAATSRDGLTLTAGRPHGDAEARAQVHASQAFHKLFGRSLKLRQVSAGGCNACELELGAAANVNFDVSRFGIDWVASPRHADALVLSGTLTRTMRDAVRLCWDAMPEPRFVVAVGACAISGGLHEGSRGVDRGFLDDVAPALYVPGCPPHPLTFVNAILDFLGVP